MKERLKYPVEYLCESFIHPLTLRKQELAYLLDMPWPVIRRKIQGDESLLRLLVQFHYSISTKVLYQTHVAILFEYFGPPVASEKNKVLLKRIA